MASILAHHALQRLWRFRSRLSWCVMRPEPERADFSLSERKHLQSLASGEANRVCVPNKKALVLTASFNPCSLRRYSAVWARLRPVGEANTAPS